MLELTRGGTYHPVGLVPTGRHVGSSLPALRLQVIHTMDISRFVLSNVVDALALGPRFPLRHVAAFLGATTYRVNAKEIGPIVLRSRSSDASTFRQAFVDNGYRLPAAHQARMQTRYREILERGQTPLIIDAGANVGAATRWFARLYPQAAIAAVEPESSNLQMLERNTADLARVRIVSAALGGRSGAVTLSPSSAQTGWAVRTLREEATAAQRTTVPVVTIAELAERPDEALFIAKIDIEGFEADVFRENTEWIDRVSCIFIEPHDWMLPEDRTSQSLQQALLGKGFDLLITGENLAFVR